MNKAKYIVYTGDHGLEEMIIFSELQTHSDIAQRLRVTGDIISAGFLHVGTNVSGEAQASCYGDSVSLKVKAREEEDSVLAERTLAISRDW